MIMLDRFQPLKDYEERDLPICEECGEECCVGLDEAIYIEEKDSYFCCVECLVKYDIINVVQSLGGKFV